MPGRYREPSHTPAPMLHLLDPHDATASFPNPESAETEPNGLLAIGGDLSRERLLNAYRLGIFPWYNEEQPILWWSPDPRTVLFPSDLYISRSLRKTLRRRTYMATVDRAFEQVLDGCAAPRPGQNGTWLIPEMRAAYLDLHRAGFAHSVEIWRDYKLVGGLYGVALGRVFYGESMFSRANDASKVALVHLVNRLSEWSYGLIDCQMYTEHLARLGAQEIPRWAFNQQLGKLIAKSPSSEAWRREEPLHPVDPDEDGVRQDTQP